MKTGKTVCILSPWPAPSSRTCSWIIGATLIALEDSVLTFPCQFWYFHLHWNTFFFLRPCFHRAERWAFHAGSDFAFLAGRLPLPQGPQIVTSISLISWALNREWFLTSQCRKFRGFRITWLMPRVRKGLVSIHIFSWDLIWLNETKY